MTDEVINTIAEPVVNQETSSPEAVSSSNVDQSASVGTSIENVSQPKAEKMFTRDEVAKIANAEKQKAVEKARKEFELSQHMTMQPTAPVQSYANIPPQQNYNVGMMPTQPMQGALSSEQVQQVQQAIAQQAQVQAKEMFLQTAVDDFSSKIGDAEKRYPDYHEVVNELELDRLQPEVLRNMVALINVADNAADVLYEMGKDPAKFKNLYDLACFNSKHAIKKVRELSHSIKENDAARNARVANPPLSQITPSTTGVDNGVMTIKDYKKQPWARG